MLGRRQTKVGHHLARIVEADEIAHLGNDGDSRHEGHATHGLKRLNDRRHGPSWNQILDLLRQAGDALFGVMHRVDIVLQDNLLGRMVEANRRQPAAIGECPALLSGIDAAMPQEESLQVLTRLAQHPDCRCARPDQIPHRLMGCIRNPNSGQLTGSVQLRQHHRVSPIRLDAIAGFHRNQRGRHDRAFMAKICDLPMQPITARAGFVAEP